MGEPKVITPELSLARCNWRPSPVRARTKLTELKQETDCGTRAGKRIRCALLLSPYPKRKWQPKQTLEWVGHELGYVSAAAQQMWNPPLHFHWPHKRRLCLDGFQRRLRCRMGEQLRAFALFLSRSFVNKTKFRIAFLFLFFFFECNCLLIRPLAC